MIKSFADKYTEALWRTARTRYFSPAIAQRAYSRLQLLNAALTLNFLRHPPSHHLEALHGRRDGQHSIRINDQYRLCFTWDAQTADAYDVEITDYH